MSEFIKLEEVIITDKILKVSASSTTYLSEHMPEKIDIKALLARFKAACADAKGKGIKINHKNKTRKIVADNADQYELDYAKYKAAFDATAALAKSIFVDKPLPVGTSDNMELKAMYQQRNAMAPFFFNSSIFSRIYDFESRVNDFEMKIAHIENGEGHTFYF
ncbi:hypothetical protein ACTG16_22850 [Aeromonas sp. 23P]|uniref:hypothetical protein n=1 Tax=Aeromonas sp. 23P TaxID=3452716 RepID=UPI003F7AFDA5